MFVIDPIEEIYKDEEMIFSGTPPAEYDHLKKRKIPWIIAESFTNKNVSEIRCTLLADKTSAVCSLDAYYNKLWNLKDIKIKNGTIKYTPKTEFSIIKENGRFECNYNSKENKLMCK